MWGGLGGSKGRKPQRNSWGIFPELLLRKVLVLASYFNFYYFLGKAWKKEGFQRGLTVAHFPIVYKFSKKIIIKSPPQAPPLAKWAPQNPGIPHPALGKMKAPLQTTSEVQKSKSGLRSWEKYWGSKGELRGLPAPICCTL